MTKPFNSSCVVGDYYLSCKKKNEKKAEPTGIYPIGKYKDESSTIHHQLGSSEFLMMISVYHQMIPFCLNWNQNLITTLVAMASIISIALVFSFRGEEMMTLLTGSPLEIVFDETKENRMIVCAFCISSFTVAVNNSLVWLIEERFPTRVDLNDGFERGSLAVILGMGSLLMVIYINDHRIPLIFAASHLFQGSCTHFVCTSFFHKLFPKHFSITMMTLSNTFMLITVLFLSYGYGLSYSNEFNIMGTFSGVSSIAIIVKCIMSWGINLDILSRWCQTSKRNGTSLTVAEIYCSLYSFCYVLLAVAAGVVTFINLSDFTRFCMSSILLFIGSFVVFGILVSTIPLYLVANLSNQQKQREMDLVAATEAKKRIIRYLSHEMRSPLSGISTSVGFMLEDLKSGEWTAEGLLEGLETVQHGCSSTIGILDGTLMMEKMEAGLFEMTLTMVKAVSSIIRMLSGLRVHTRPRRQTLNVVNLVDPSVSPALGVLINDTKMEQVLRNLMTNAAKFSPKGATITAYIRYEPREAMGPQLSEMLITPCAQTSTQQTQRRVRGGVRGGGSTRHSRYDHHRVVPCASNDCPDAPPDGDKVVDDKEEEEGEGDDGEEGKGNEEGDSIDDTLDGGDAVHVPTAPIPCGHLLIEVVDCGPGISEANTEKLFGEFAQFDAGRLQGGGGNGLGLWLSREIVKQHGGSLTYKPRKATCISHPSTHASTQPSAHPIEPIDSRDPVSVPAPATCTGSVFTVSLPCYFDNQENDDKPCDIGVQIDLLLDVANQGCDGSVTDDACLQSDRRSTTVQFKEFGDIKAPSKVSTMDDAATSVPKPHHHHHHHHHPQHPQSYVDGASLRQPMADFPYFDSSTAPSIPFTVPLSTRPLDSAPAPATETAQATAQAQAQAAPGVRILVVDDIEMIRKITADAIDRHFLAAAKRDPSTPAHTVLQANDGAPAVALVRESLQQGYPVDLVILDNIMLTINGPEAAQLMREAGYEGRIVGHTGNVFDENVAKFVAHGVESILTKPLEREALDALLRDITKRFMAQRSTNDDNV